MLLSSLMVYDICTGNSSLHRTRCEEDINASYVDVSSFPVFLKNYSIESLSIYTFCDIPNSDGSAYINVDDLEPIKKLIITANIPNTKIFFDADLSSHACDEYIFTNVNVTAYSTINTKNLTLINSIADHTSFKTNSICMDLSSTFIAEEWSFLSITIDLSHKITENKELSFAFSNISFIKVSENLSLIFSGEELIIRSDETKKSITLKLIKSDSICSISNFAKPNLRLSVSNLFISSIFRDFKLNISIDQRMAFVVKPSEWERSAIREFTVYEYCNCVNVIESEYVPAMFYFMNRTFSQIILCTQNTSFIKNIKLFNASITFRRQKSLVGNAIVLLDLIQSHAESCINFDEKTTCAVKVFYQEGDEHEKLFVNGTVTAFCATVKSGVIKFTRVINMENNSFFYIMKPYGKIIADEHITNNNSLTVKLAIKGEKSDFDQESLIIGKTDNSSLYVLKINNDMLEINNNKYIVSGNITTKNSTVIVFAKLKLFSHKAKSIEEICIMENESYKSYCENINNSFTQSELEPDYIMKYASKEDLSIYVAGNVSILLSGISKIALHLQIIGLVPNNSYLHTDDAHFYVVYLSNVTLISKYESKDDPLVFEALTSMNSFLIAKTKPMIFHCQTSLDEVNRFIPMCNVKAYTIINCSNSAQLYAYDDYIIIDDINVSVTSINNVWLRNNLDYNEINASIYGDSISKVYFSFYSMLFVYCYNRSCSINSRAKRTMFIHTAQVPENMVFPDKVYISNNITHLAFNELDISTQCLVYAHNTVCFSINKLLMKSVRTLSFTNVVFDIECMNIYDTSLILSINATKVNKIVIDPLSYIFLNINGEFKEITVTYIYYIGSIPMLSLTCNADFVHFNMNNNASSSQMLSYRDWEDVQVLAIRMKTAPKKYDITYSSNVWAFNNDTRIFDLVETKENDIIEFVIKKRKAEDSALIEEDTRSKTNLIIIALIVTSVILVVILIVFIVRKRIVKSRITNYIEVVSESLVDVVNT